MILLAAGMDNPDATAGSKLAAKFAGKSLVHEPPNPKSSAAKPLKSALKKRSQQSLASTIKTEDSDSEVVVQGESFDEDSRSASSRASVFYSAEFSPGQPGVDPYEAVFLEAQRDVLLTMFRDSFPRYIRNKLIFLAHQELMVDQRRARDWRTGEYVVQDPAIGVGLDPATPEQLAMIKKASKRKTFDGIGDCYCLTNPSIQDNPIVLVSDGFLRLTGHIRHEILNRNCRFLQGELTDKRAIERIRRSLKEGREVSELLLNYKRDGTPFWNLLFITPLRSIRTGRTEFFLGGQIDVTANVMNDTYWQGLLQDDLQSPIGQKTEDDDSDILRPTTPYHEDDQIERPDSVSVREEGPLAAFENLGNVYFPNLMHQRGANERKGPDPATMMVGDGQMRHAAEFANRGTNVQGTGADKSNFVGAETMVVNDDMGYMEQSQKFYETYSIYVVFSGDREQGFPVQYCSRKFLSLTGYMPSHVVGQLPHFLVSPKTSRRNRNILKNAFIQGKPVSVKVYSHDRDRHLYTNHMHLNPLRDGKGVPQLFVCVMIWQRVVKSNKKGVFGILKRQITGQNDVYGDPTGSRSGSSGRSNTNLPGSPRDGYTSFTQSIMQSTDPMSRTGLNMAPALSHSMSMITPGTQEPPAADAAAAPGAASRHGSYHSRKGLKQKSSKSNLARDYTRDDYALGAQN